MKLNFIFGLLFSVVALQMKGAGGTPEGLLPFVRFPGLEQEVYITRDTSLYTFARITRNVNFLGWSRKFTLRVIRAKV